MARLPKPGGDDGSWGNVLNDFLAVEHDDTGALKNVARPSDVAAKYTLPTSGIPETDLATAVQTKLDSAGAGAPDADVSTKGIVRLAGDLAGVGSTAAAPKVLGTVKQFRGSVAASTAYNPGDLVVYRGKRVLIVAAVTSGTGAAPFMSGSTYMSLGPENVVNAQDYGYAADGNVATAPANTTALKAAMAYCAALGGGTVEIPVGFGYVAKDGSNPCAIDIPPFVMLKGMGMSPTRIQLSPNQDCDVIKTHTSTGSGNPNAYFCGVMNLTIDGNKANQTVGGHGLNLSTNPQYTAQSGDAFFDMHHWVQNVRIQNCKQDGFHAFGRSASVLDNVYVQTSDGWGFNGTFDTMYSNCQAQSNTAGGFNRVAQGANLKAFLNGGHGLVQASGGGSVAVLQSQNNGGAALVLDGVQGCEVTGLAADTNNFSNSGYAAVMLINGASNNRVSGVSSQTSQAGAGVLGYQQDCLSLSPASTKNVIDLAHYAGSGNTVNDPGVQGVIPAGNVVRVNGKSLTGGIATLADTTITSPTDGQVLVYDTASSKWKNGSPGAGAAFAVGLFGDGSDGSLVFDGAATVNGATRSASIYTMTRDVYAVNITVNAGITLKTGGFKIFANGTTTIAATGIVSNDGNDGAAIGTAGAATGAGSTAAGVVGGVGNATAGTAGSNNSTVAATIGVGTSGAGGASGTGNAGGAQAFAANATSVPLRSAINAASSLIVSGGAIRAISGAPSGGGGGGDGTNKGGGGGGGGGAILIFSRTLINHGTLSVKGGNGGSPTTGSAGGGGGGGGGLIASYSLSGWTNDGTTVVTGGTGGTPVGTGVVGSNGSAGTVTNFVVT